jgi:hypothetical protein
MVKSSTDNGAEGEEEEVVEDRAGAAVLVIVVAIGRGILGGIGGGGSRVLPTLLATNCSCCAGTLDAVPVPGPAALTAAAVVFPA